jgi:hypothetical protein
MSNEFDQFSDVGRMNNPRFHTPVNDLEMQPNENHRLNGNVCPLDEICELEGAEYSYAYYEPGPPTSHANFLVNNANPCSDRNNRHTYVTRYGTEENIYEEISEVSAKLSRLAEQDRVHPHRWQQQHRQNHQSQLSLNQSVLEEEVRRVQSRHRRVLGELNLTVEAMLMPPPPPKDEESNTSSDKGSGPPFLLEDLLLSVGPTDELLSPASCSIGDHDSGFSGSSGNSYGFSGSSGASCNTSVLSGNSLRRRACENGSGSSQSFPRTAGAVSAPGYSPLSNRRAVKSGAGCLKLNKTRESANSCKAQPQNKQNQQEQSHHHGFFGRKGWIRLPGFGSSQPSKGKSQFKIMRVRPSSDSPELKKVRQLLETLPTEHPRREVCILGTVRLDGIEFFKIVFRNYEPPISNQELLQG